MAYITAARLRDRLPLDGEGVSDEQVQEAIDAAVDYVAALTGDESGESALARQAAASLAHADLLDVVFPRDARDDTAQAVILRENAQRALAAYAEANPKPPEPEKPLTATPPGYVTELRY